MGDEGEALEAIIGELKERITRSMPSLAPVWFWDHPWHPDGGYWTDLDRWPSPPRRS